jgi:hypothetical protein
VTDKDQLLADSPVAPPVEPLETLVAPAESQPIEVDAVETPAEEIKKFLFRYWPCPHLCFV